MVIGATLYVYKGEWGLPSIDFECLRALCLVRFTRCPVAIDTKSNPFKSRQGKLPYLEIGCEKFVGYREIKKLLDKKGFPVDQNLDKKSKFLSQAYSEMIFNDLHPYFNYFLYGNSENFNKTRAFYAKRTPFPFNFYYPGYYKDEARNIINILSGFDLNEVVKEEDINIIINNTKRCINFLSKKLAKKVWFFGDIYSEFDAIVFSYLSILLKINLENNPIQNHLKCCQNLINFINRITKDIFKNEAFNSTKPIRNSDSIAHNSKPNNEYSETNRQIIAGIVAATAMSAFAFWKGLYNQLLISRPYDNEDYSNDEITNT